MSTTGDDRFYRELTECTARLAEVVSQDLAHPVPTCPEWTFRKLATHVGRGHRWAAEIVERRATEAVAVQDVADGKLPDDPTRHAQWLAAGAAQVITAVEDAGDTPVWTFLGMRPARFWARRRAHEAAVHMADALLATGGDIGLSADDAADAVDEWLGILAAVSDPANEAVHGWVQGVRGDGQTLHFHATDDGLGGAGEWLVRRTPYGVAVEPGHAKADVAVRGPALDLLLVLTGRQAPTTVGIDVLGDEALFAHWTAHTRF